MTRSDIGPAFYARHSVASDPGDFAVEMATWPRDVAGLLEIIQGLMIYDAAAKSLYGCTLPPERMLDIHLGRTRDLLQRAASLDQQPLHLARAPVARVAARCNLFCLLLCSALRTQGRPARLRAGFSPLFNPGKFEDHWVCEYWDMSAQRWRRADVQFDKVWIAAFGFDHDVADLPPGAFLPAAEIWRRCRAGSVDAANVGIHFAGLYGIATIAGNLVRDLAALNRVETRPWDVWGAMPPPDAALSPDQLGYFDDLGDLLSDPDANPDAIQQRYDRDEGLRVGETVFNALLRKTEKVAHHG